MSALWAHGHLLTSIKIQVQNGMESVKLLVRDSVLALGEDLMGRLTAQLRLHHTVMIEALEDARRANDQYQIVVGILASTRVQLDEMTALVHSERQRRIDAQRTVLCRLVLLENAADSSRD